MWQCSHRGGVMLKSSSCTAFSYPILLWLSLLLMMMMADSLTAVPHQMHQPVLSTTIDFQVSFTCTSEFTLHDSHCYRYFGAESRRAFYHAEKQCTHFHSTLVSLLSHDEEEFVVQLVANNTAFWIGLNDEDGPGSTHMEGVFKWTSGEEHSSARNNIYENWKSGEPNNRRHLDCVKADASGWAMATGGCAASKLPFVCKKKACPEGLDWDGASCDLIIEEDVSDNVNFEASHWSIMGGWQTLIFILLASLVVMVSSLAVRARTANKQRSLESTPNYILRENCKVNSRRIFRTPLVNRVEDLVVQTS